MKQTRCPNSLPNYSEELDMVMMSEVLLISNRKLQKILANSPKDKFAVVLTIPLFPNWIEGMMKVFQELNLTGDVPTSNKELSSLIGECHSKEVMDKIREIDDHVKRNQSTILTNPLFAVTPGEKRKEFRCCYCIYKSGKLWKDNLDRLPNPPTIFNVQQNKSNLSLHVDWKFQNQGYPYNAMILYRTKSNGSGFPWKRQKTSDLSKTTIYFEPGSVVEILIAMDTCIGRSEFCAFETERLPLSVVDTPIEMKNNPKRSPVVEGATTGPPQTDQKTLTSFVPPTFLQVENVTDCAAELLWLSSIYEDCQVNFWRHEKETSAQSLKAARSSIGCRLEKLQAGATYSFNIAAVSGDGQGTSLPSQIVQFTTQKTKVARFAEKMAKRCEKVGSENGLDLYAVPLTKSLDGMAEIFSFGEVGQSKQQKTIMLVGVTDTAVKSRLINGMINYIFNVDWLDSFRFQLISDQATNVPVKKYHIHHTEGFRIPYSLTIIDTPDRVSIEHQLVENPRFIPFHANAVDYSLDWGIFVDDMPQQPSRPFCLFDSIMTVYRNVEIAASYDVSDDNQLPLNNGPKNGIRHKFDSSVFFCWNRKTEQELETDEFYAPHRHHFQSYYREYLLNRFMWFVAMKNFDCVFVSDLRGGLCTI